MNILFVACRFEFTSRWFQLFPVLLHKDRRHNHSSEVRLGILSHSSLYKPYSIFILLTKTKICFQY